MGVIERLSELGVVPASALSAGVVTSGAERRLPVLSSFSRVLPGGLPRGATVAVSARGAGATSLLLALLAGVADAGAWCAVVGLPALSWAAVVDAGVDLERLAMVPEPGPEAAAVTATLLDGMDVVVAAIPGRPAAQVCSHLSARARTSKAVLVAAGSWPGATLTIEATSSEWVGRRRLRAQRVEVVVSGRGGAGRPRRDQVWLPAEPPEAVIGAAPAGAERAAGAARLRAVS